MSLETSLYSLRTSARYYGALLGEGARLRSRESCNKDATFLAGFGANDCLHSPRNLEAEYRRRV